MVIDWFQYMITVPSIQVNSIRNLSYSEMKLGRSLSHAYISNNYGYKTWYYDWKTQRSGCKYDIVTYLRSNIL